MGELLWAAVINAVVSVPIMVAVMLAACSPGIMDTLVLSMKWRVRGWAAAAEAGQQPWPCLPACCHGD